MKGAIKCAIKGRWKPRRRADQALDARRLMWAKIEENYSLSCWRGFLIWTIFSDGAIILDEGAIFRHCSAISLTGGSFLLAGVSRAVTIIAVTSYVYKDSLIRRHWSSQRLMYCTLCFGLALQIAFILFHFVFLPVLFSFIVFSRNEIESMKKSAPSYSIAMRGNNIIIVIKLNINITVVIIVIIIVVNVVTVIGAVTATSAWPSYRLNKIVSTSE